MAERKTREALTEEELERASAEELPDRQAMSLIRAQPLPEPIVPIDPQPGVVPLEDPQPDT